MENKVSKSTITKLALLYPYLCLNASHIHPNFFYDSKTGGKFPTSLRELYQPIQLLIDELSKNSLELDSLNKEIFLLKTQNAIFESTLATFIAQERETPDKHTPADLISLLEYRDLKQRYDRKTQMLYTVTHDLKSPLASIQGFTELLREGMVGPITEEMEKHLDLIISNSKRMARMIESILEYERYDSSEYKVEKDSIEFLLGKVDLTPREIKIINLYLKQQKTFEETGKVIGLSKERVRQIYCGIVNRLKEYVRDKELCFEDYIE